MKTTHKLIFSNANNMSQIESNSIHLVCTSPIYPMIEIWDTSFGNQNSKISEAFKNGNGNEAFELMNQILDRIWNEVKRILVPGGVACINIGDANRTINKNFQLFSNHSRILSHFLKIGFQSLPEIIWHKQTNSPNKFMGSGMLPPGAYVTHEHEFILVLRNGNKRVFDTESEKEIRRESCYFWEERNNWFSDIWEVKGTKQKLVGDKTRNRSAAFPFELPYRLINMFSVKNDVVLDPFLGTGTTTLAAITSGRNSIGYELDSTLKEVIKENIINSLKSSNNYIENRLQKHKNFVKKRKELDLPIKYSNQYYNFPVITNQETKLYFNKLKSIIENGENEFTAHYEEKPEKMSAK
ncbi:MAG: DNA-methyltransferase [Candidatus Hodarchaeales archaeon]|jgi:DNA modification methylase